MEMMMSDLSDPGSWAQFGLGGLVILVLFVMLFKVQKMHKDERSDWRRDIFEARKDDREQSHRLTDAITSLRDLINQNKG